MIDAERYLWHRRASRCYFRHLTPIKGAREILFARRPPGTAVFGVRKLEPYPSLVRTASSVPAPAMSAGKRQRWTWRQGGLRPGPCAATWLLIWILRPHGDRSPAQRPAGAGQPPRRLRRRRARAATWKPSADRPLAQALSPVHAQPADSRRRRPQRPLRHVAATPLTVVSRRRVAIHAAAHRTEPPFIHCRRLARQP